MGAGEFGGLGRRRLTDRTRGSWVVFVVVWGTLLWRAPDFHYFLTNLDHGFQIGTGWLINNGQLPFIDFVLFYGPLVPYMSALAQWLHASPVSEIVLCATGYAAAIGLAHAIVSRYVGGTGGWVAALVALLFLSRFYKYYYWLFPALALLAADRALMSRRVPNRRETLCAGVLIGIAALFRVDLGIALGCFLLLVLLTSLLRATGGWKSARWLQLGLGTAVPGLVWLAVLAAQGGVPAIRDYVTITYEGTLGYVARNRGAGAGGWSREWIASFPMAVWVLPIFYASAFFAGAIAIGNRAFRHRSRAPMLIAAAVLGGGLLPQLLQRPDAFHVPQPLLPLFVCAPLLFAQLWNWRRRGRVGLAAVGRRTLAFGLLGLLVTAGWQARGAAAFDLLPFAHDAGAKYRALLGGLDDPGNDQFWADLMRLVRAETSEGDRIIVFDNGTQWFRFAERRLSGLFTPYSGVFISREWRNRNMNAILRAPPSVIVIRGREAFFQAPPQEGLVRRLYPNVFDLVEARFTRVLLDRHDVLVLAADR